MLSLFGREFETKAEARRYIIKQKNVVIDQNHPAHDFFVRLSRTTGDASFKVRIGTLPGSTKKGKSIILDILNPVSGDTIVELNPFRKLNEEVNRQRNAEPVDAAALSKNDLQGMIEAAVVGFFEKHNVKFEIKRG